MSESAKPNAAVTVGKTTFANDRPIAVFAGPCQMESRAHALEMASALKEIAGRLGLTENQVKSYLQYSLELLRKHSDWSVR